MPTKFSIVFLALTLVISTSVFLVSSAQSVLNQTPRIDSLQRVKAIYLGYIDGHLNQTTCFKEHLKFYLSRYGFNITDEQSTADALLLGSLQRFGNFGGYTSHANVILVNQEYQTLWSAEAETPLLLADKYLFIKDGRLNGVPACSGRSERKRALDISRKLLKAYKKP